MKHPRTHTLSLLALLASGGGCQTFDDLLVGLDYPNVTETCLEALNTTVSNCPGFLKGVSVYNTRLSSEQLGYLCTSDCQNGLQSAREVIASGCSASTDILEFDGVVWPATYVIDRYLYTYDVGCRKDASSGQYCDEIFFSWLNASSSSFTTAQNCSDCMLGVMETQLNSPFGYHEEFAEDFQSLAASCGATGYSYTSPAPYSITTNPSAAPTDATCSAPYVVQSGDSCYSIATAQGVSTNSIIQAGSLDPTCSNLLAGASLCLPEACSLYAVQYDDTCESIVEAYSNVTAYQLLLWNSNINALCTNIRSMVGTFLCVSAPGGDVNIITSTATTAAPTTTSTTAVPRPTNARDNSTSNCAKWYTIEEGDYCESVSIRQGISLKDFYFLNPSIDASCTNLLLDIAYCVEAVGSITTYPGYPITTPLYTLTSSAYTTTTATFSTTTASITPIVTSALADGTRSDCVDYVQYIDVPAVTDQTESNDAGVLTNSINSCDYATTAYEVSIDDFIAWNPSLASLDDCQLQANYRYCALNSSSYLPEPTTNNGCLNVTSYPGTISTCSCFTEIDGSSVGLYLCEDIASDSKITLDDLTLWNPWVGSDCDAGLYDGLTDTDSRAVCIGNDGTATTSSSTTATASATSTASVGPTQTGIPSSCTAYHTAVDGDGCWSIANDAGITLDQFYAWNPAVGSDCSNLWLGYSYCIAVTTATTTVLSGTTTTTSTAATAGPTQSGTPSTCTVYHTVVSGDGCYSIEQEYGITFEIFYKWNPSIGSSCENMWLGYSYCVAGGPN